MITKLELTQSNAQQNSEQSQNRTMGTIKSTTYQQQQNHHLRTGENQAGGGV